LHIKVEEFFGGLFERHGRFVARHPWAVIIGVAIIDIGLGLGLLKIQTDNSIEQYAPKDSTASKHREEEYVTDYNKAQKCRQRITDYKTNQNQCL
ncbi:hypothetical protein AM593_10350, partial [Mytilus galloprovincialis]